MNEAKKIGKNLFLCIGRRRPRPRGRRRFSVARLSAIPDLDGVTSGLDWYLDRFVHFDRPHPLPVDFDVVPAPTDLRPDCLVRQPQRCRHLLFSFAFTKRRCVGAGRPMRRPPETLQPNSAARSQDAARARPGQLGEWDVTFETRRHRPGGRRRSPWTAQPASGPSTFSGCRYALISMRFPLGSTIIILPCSVARLQRRWWVALSPAILRLNEMRRAATPPIEAWPRSSSHRSVAPKCRERGMGAVTLDGSFCKVICAPNTSTSANAWFRRPISAPSS